jgi:hypothetical protein
METSKMLSAFYINVISKDELKNITDNCTSWTEVMNYFRENYGYKRISGNATVKKKCIDYGIDFSHFKRKYTRRQNNPPKKDINEFLVKNCTVSTCRLKKRLYEEKLLEERCYSCGIGNTWNNKPITLQLEHIDGDHCNNEITNLTILCPNCHSQTSTFSIKNKSKEILDFINKPVEPIKLNLEAKTVQENGKYCMDCDKEISKNAVRCVRCAGIENNKDRKKVVDRPSIEQLKEDLRTMSVVKVGQKYGVSDNSIRKWIKPN